MNRQVTVTITQSAEEVVVTNGSETWRFAYHGVDGTTRAASATIAQAMLTGTITDFLSLRDKITLNLTLETEQL